MESDFLDRKMKALEPFRQLRMLPGTWGVIRVDGRGFTRLTEQFFEKPFDERFRDMMVAAAQALLEELGGIYVYSMSDEISVLLPRQWEMYDRRVEKVVSISAGIASSVFSVAARTPIQFDSRVWLGAEDEMVIDYFSWRQAEASRNCLYSWCYWSLRKQGEQPRKVTEMLRGKSLSEQNELLFQQGINFNNVPLWQRRGVALYTEMCQKEGYDPVAAQAVTSERRQIRIDWQLPMKEEYRQFVRRVMESRAK